MCVLHTAELPLSSPDTNSEENQEYKNNTILEFLQFIDIINKKPDLYSLTGFIPN